GREAPQARPAPDGRARGARVDRAGRGRHDRPPGRPSSQVRGFGAAHRPDQRRARDHARGPGRPPAARAGRHRGGRMKRKAAPRPTRKPRRKPRAALPQAPRDADPLAGSALRPLLERYCKLAGVKQAALGPDHVELKLPPAERPFFRDRERVSVAFSLDALERDPEAEIAVLGSPFVSQVVEAIRARGAHLSLGLIASASSASSPLSRRERGTGGEDLRERGDEAVELPIPVRDGVAKPGATRLAVHPVGRLAARVVLRAGAGVEEAVVETDVYDLSAGAPAGADVAA